VASLFFLSWVFSIYDKACRNSRAGNYAPSWLLTMMQRNMNQSGPTAWTPFELFIYFAPTALDAGLHGLSVA
jgi:hypothetical protein